MGSQQDTESQKRFDNWLIMNYGVPLKYISERDREEIINEYLDLLKVD